MKQVVFVLLTAMAMMLTSCSTSNPNFTTDYPIFYLMNISAPGSPVACCYFGSNGDGLAGAGTHLLFIDRDAGYVRADKELGQPVNGVTTTAEGGYGVAVCGTLLYYVSNNTYELHEAVVLPVNGSFVLTKPQSNTLYVIGYDGTVAEVETVMWTVTGTHSTDVSSPVAAVISPDGQALFIADGSDNTVKKLSTADFATLAECAVDGGVADLYTGPGNSIYAAPAARSEIWSINTGTGLHDYTYQFPGYPVSVAVTPDGKYLFAGCTGHGTVVVNTQTGEQEIATADYDVPNDIAILGSGGRSMLCVESRQEIYVLQK